MAGGSLGGGDEILAEINVTPMVDVLLSMLIIFMVAQPTPPNEQLPLNVPQEAVVHTPSDPNASLLVRIDAEGNARIGQTPLPRGYDEIVAQLRNHERAQQDGRIVIQGDDKTRYGLVVELMAAAHEAGIEEVGIASNRL